MGCFTIASTTRFPIDPATATSRALSECSSYHPSKRHPKPSSLTHTTTPKPPYTSHLHYFNQIHKHPCTTYHYNQQYPHTHLQRIFFVVWGLLVFLVNMQVLYQLLLIFSVTGDSCTILLRMAGGVPIPPFFFFILKPNMKCGAHASAARHHHRRGCPRIPTSQVFTYPDGKGSSNLKLTRRQVPATTTHLSTHAAVYDHQGPPPCAPRLLGLQRWSEWLCFRATGMRNDILTSASPASDQLCYSFSPPRRLHLNRAADGKASLGVKPQVWQDCNVGEQTSASVVPDP
jgi:hypothetical protein